MIFFKINKTISETNITPEKASRRCCARSTAGFTLIEVLITTAVMAIVGGLMTGIFYTVTNVNQRETASGEVTSQLNFVTQRIQELVRTSSNVEISAGTTTSTLKLRMADSAKDPTCVIFSSGTIQLAEGPDSNNPQNCTSVVTNLTSNQVTVNSLNFKKFTQYPGHDTVSFDLAITYNSSDPAAQVQRTLQSAVARVSAATFDSNLLPGDTSYTIGQAGSSWQNLFAADGTAANPSYTFGNSTGLGLFRSGADILGISTAGAERLTIDASGNIGVGTTTPSTIFTVSGTSTFAGNIALAGSTSTYKITNLAAPASGSDAATKAYVDANVGDSLPANFVGWFTTSTAITGWTYLKTQDTGTTGWTTKTSTNGYPTVWAQTAVANSKIYMLGGGDSNGGQSAKVREYDPASDTWANKTDITTPRIGAIAETVNGKIYVIGGNRVGIGATNITEQYDPVADSWASKANSPDLIYQGVYLSSGAVANNKIYTFGAYYNTSGTYEYDPATNGWTSKANMPTIRYYTTAASVNNIIYVVGGSSTAWTGLNEAYDPSSNTWTTKTSMTTARGHSASAVISDKIYVLGGQSAAAFNGNSLTTNEAYDPATNTWTAKTSMGTARYALSAAAVNSKIYALGGRNTTDYLTTNEEYQEGLTLYLFSKD